MQQVRSHSRHPQLADTSVRAQGFTLIELMVTIAVLAVVLAIAFPSFRSIINSNRLSAASNEWLATIQVARMESLRRNNRVVICPSANGTSCGGTSWQRVIAFVDADRDGVADATDAEPVLRDTSVGAPVLVSVSPAISGATPANQITMRSDGLAYPGSASTVLQSKIGICIVGIQPAQNARRVSLSGSRVSVDPPSVVSGCTTPADI